MDRDRLNRLERELALVARQIAGLPVRIGEAGGGGGSSLRRARVYGGSISAATGNLTAAWGSGNVKFMDDDTGVLDEDPTAVDNQWDYAFVQDAMVSINTAFDPPRVEPGTCAAFVGWTEGT